MLKKSLFSPAQPLRAETRFPRSAFSHRSDPQRGPGRLTTRRRAQTWCSLFVAPCAPEGTPPGLHSLRPCWTGLLSILPDELRQTHETVFEKESWRGVGHQHYALAGPGLGAAGDFHHHDDRDGAGD